MRLSQERKNYQINYYLLIKKNKINYYLQIYGHQIIVVNYQAERKQKEKF